MVIPIPPIVMPTAPATNITPFTYRDGLSYLQRLERIVKYINNVVKPYIDESYGELAEAFEEQVNILIEQFNEIVSEIIGGSVELQDPILAALLLDLDSESRIALNSILTTLIIEDPADEGTFITNIVSA